MRKTIDKKHIPAICSKIDEYRKVNTPWVAIKELLNTKYNYEFGESVYRKIFDSYEIGHKEKLDTNLLDNELERIAKARNRIAVERRVSTLQKQALNKTLRNEGMVETITNHIIDKVKYKEVEVKCVKNISKLQKEETFIIADMHYQEKDKFILSSDIIEVSITESRNDILKLIFLGESIEGKNHLSNVVETNVTSVAQGVQIAQFITSWIIQVSKINNQVNVFSVLNSNHGEFRYHNTKGNDFKEESMENMIWQIVMGNLANYKNVKFTIQYKLDIEVMGLRTFATHGRELKSLGGAVKHAEDKMLAIEKKYDMFLFGHFHDFTMKYLRSGTLLIGAPSAKTWVGQFDHDANMNKPPGILRLTKDEAKDISVKFIKIPRIEEVK